MARRKKASQMTSQEIKMVDGDLPDFFDPTEEEAEEEAIPSIERNREENWMIEFRREQGRWLVASATNRPGTVPGLVDNLTVPN